MEEVEQIEQQAPKTYTTTMDWCTIFPFGIGVVDAGISTACFWRYMVSCDDWICIIDDGADVFWTQSRYNDPNGTSSSVTATGVCL